jgi:toxin ParE1/3/4
VIRLEFHPSARDELRAAVRFYRQESPGLAWALMGEVRSALDRVREFPQSGSPSSVAAGTRRVFLDRFPFTLVYREQPDAIEILAVMHQRQRPGYWRSRAGEP